MIHDAELFTVGCDEAVVTFRTDEDATVVTVVGEHEVSTSGRLHAARVTGLEAATEYPLRVDGVDASELLPAVLTTLPRPSGRRVATFATVNDVHFGEFECGKLGTPEELGPVFSTEPGDTPYYEVMNRGAIAEIAALDPDAVVVKGDLTNLGEEWEYELFCNAYTQLGARMHHVRGNHDAMLSAKIAATGPFTVELDGITLAVLDTVIPGHENGQVTPEQFS
ncbi:MAG TPA: metallophosphoesterase, partial [Acidimicrobiia bacterium]|nr:metallophosphoesterase [Acidimicrobiia bacterium]